MQERVHRCQVRRIQKGRREVDCQHAPSSSRRPALLISPIPRSGAECAAVGVRCQERFLGQIGGLIRSSFREVRNIHNNARLLAQPEQSPASSSRRSIPCTRGARKCVVFSGRDHTSHAVTEERVDHLSLSSQRIRPLQREDRDSRSTGERLPDPLMGPGDAQLFFCSRSHLLQRIEQLPRSLMRARGARIRAQQLANTWAQASASIHCGSETCRPLSGFSNALPSARSSTVSQVGIKTSKRVRRRP